MSGFRRDLRVLRPCSLLQADGGYPSAGQPFVCGAGMPEAPHTRQYLAPSLDTSPPQSLLQSSCPNPFLRPQCCVPFPRGPEVCDRR